MREKKQQCCEKIFFFSDDLFPPCAISAHSRSWGAIAKRTIFFSAKQDRGKYSQATIAVVGDCHSGGTKAPESIFPIFSPGPKTTEPESFRLIHDSGQNL